MARLRLELGLDLDPGLLFNHPTYRDLLTAIRDAPPLPPEDEGDADGALDGNDGEELSGEALSIWLAESINPGLHLFDLCDVWVVEGEVDGEALAAAFIEVVERHPALRSVVAVDIGQPRLQVEIEPRIAIVVASVERLPTGAEALTELVRTAPALDSTDGPTAGMLVLTAASGETLLAIKAHHVVADARSLGVLRSELGPAYERRVGGGVPGDSWSPVRRSTGKPGAGWAYDAEAGRAYWARQLEGLEVVGVPRDREPPVHRSYDADLVPVEIGPDLREVVAGHSRANGVTVFSSLLGIFGTCVCELACTEEVGIASPVDLRVDEADWDAVGLLVNTVVMRVGRECDADQRTRAAAETVRAALSHRWTALIEVAAAGRNRGEPPLARTAFQLVDESDDLRLAGCELRRVPLATQGALYDVVVSLMDDGKSIDGRVEYATECFDRETIDVLVNHFLVELSKLRS
jgi:hypothetical protein